VQISLWANQSRLRIVTEFEMMNESIEGLTLTGNRDLIIETETWPPPESKEFRGKNDELDSETLQRSALYEW
jgi:hypothetical protein